METGRGQPHHFQPIPKLELTMFRGTGARNWVRQCNRFFRYYNTAKMDKVPLSALYFNKKVKTWFHNHLVGRPILSWDNLSMSILSKFERLDYGRIVGSFNKLRQTSVESYIDSFEELRACLLEFNPYMENLTSFTVSLADYKKR